MDFFGPNKIFFAVSSYIRPHPFFKKHNSSFYMVYLGERPFKVWRFFLWFLGSVVIFSKIKINGTPIRFIIVIIKFCVQLNLILLNSMRHYNLMLSLLPIIFAPLLGYSSGFGNGGSLIFELDHIAAFNKIEVTNQGKIYAIGYILDDPEYTHSQNMLVCRFNANGTLDSSFANNGVKVVDFTLGNSRANDLVILSDGSVVLVGETHNTSTFDVALAKLTVDGNLDLSFGSSGTLRTDYKALSNKGIAIVSDDNYLYVLDNCGVLGSYGLIDEYPCIIKYDMLGNIVTDFGTLGFRELINLHRAKGLSIYEGNLYTFGTGVLNGALKDMLNLVRLSTVNGSSSSKTVHTGSYDEWPDSSGGFMGELSISEQGKFGLGYKKWSSASSFYSNGRSFSRARITTAQDFDSLPSTSNIQIATIYNGAVNDLNNFQWQNDSSYFITYGNKIVKYTNDALDTTYGIGGEVNLEYVPTDIALYDSERVISLYSWPSTNSKYGKSEFRVFNSDGSPFISSPPVITSSLSAIGQINVPFEYTIIATNDPTQFNVAPLPSGLYLDFNNGIAKILGTPVESGVFSVSLTALNSGGSDVETLIIDISKTDQVIQFDNPGAKLLGSLPIVPVASSSSNLDITFEVVSGPATILEGDIYITGLGDIEIKATQLGNSNFEPADPVTILFTSVMAPELPVIETFPSSIQSPANSFAIFSVAASGPKPLSYRWFKNGTLIEGEENANLVLSNVSYFDEAKYQCEVSNSFGVTISTECDLNVISSEGSLDSDNDGLSDSLEIYLGALGLDPSKDSTNEWNRLLNLVQELGLTNTGLSLEEISDLRPGSTMIEVSGNQATVQLQMEESSDLQTWEDKGDPATMTIPADTDTKFFRFKMAE